MRETPACSGRVDNSGTRRPYNYTIYIIYRTYGFLIICIILTLVHCIDLTERACFVHINYVYPFLHSLYLRNYI